MNAIVKFPTDRHTPKIEKGVPFPKNWRRYPWGEMQVGDSFFCEQAAKVMSCTATSYGKRHRKKFTTRKVRENGVCGTRVWRTA